MFSPELIVTLSFDILAPADYVSMGGSSTDVVPGALITFNFEIENTGFGPASDIYITDIIPTYTAYYLNSATNNAGATVSFDRNNNGIFGESPTDNPTASPAGTPIDDEANSIRWTGGTIPKDEKKTYSFSVVVK